METIVAQKRLKLAEKDPELRPMHILELSPGAPVLVYRERPKRWEGPYDDKIVRSLQDSFRRYRWYGEAVLNHRGQPYLTDPPTSSPTVAEVSGSSDSPTRIVII